MPFNSIFDYRSKPQLQLPFLYMPVLFCMLLNETFSKIYPEKLRSLIYCTLLSAISTVEYYQEQIGSVASQST